MPKYAKPIVTQRKKKRGRPLKYSQDLYGRVLTLRLKGLSLGKIARDTQIPKTSVYRMLTRMGFN